jgi:hypothetical protein
MVRIGLSPSVALPRLEDSSQALFLTEATPTVRS